MIAAVTTALVFFVGESVDPALGAATQAAVKERLSREGAAPIDLSAEHRRLHTKPLFADFTVPPPAFLPRELVSTWTHSNEACAQQVGPTGPQLYPPQRVVAAAEARSCQQSVGLALWELLLLAKHVQRVVEVQLSRNHHTGQGASIGIWMLDPYGGGRTRPVMDVDPDRVTPAALQALEDLLGGAGTRVEPSAYTLPAVGVPELEAAAFGPPASLAKVPATCTGLPAALQVFPPGKNVTRAIEAAYRTLPAEKRTGKSLRCDLVPYPDVDVMGRPVAKARLACPPSQARAMGPVAQAPALVSSLVNGTVAALCWAQQPQ